MARKVMYQGNLYNTVKEFLDAFDVTYEVLMYRIKSGWSVEMTMRYLKDTTFSSSFKPLSYKGIEEYVAEKNLCFPVYLDYFKRTKDVKKSDKLTKLHVETKGEATIEFRGSRFKKILTVCNLYGIKETIVINRILLGEDLINILDSMVDKNDIREYTESKSLVMNGKEFTSLNHVASHHRINEGALQSRLSNGESLEDAVNHLLNRRSLYAYEKKNFKSLRALSEYTGAKSSRIKDGLDYFGDTTKAVEYALSGLKRSELLKQEQTVLDEVVIPEYEDIKNRVVYSTNFSKKRPRYNLVNRYGTTGHGTVDYVMKQKDAPFELVV